MKKDNLLPFLLGKAALLLMAATALVITSCTQDNEEPGGNVLPEGRITLVPTVAPITAWNAADTDASNAPGTRADVAVPVTLAGGEIIIMIARVPADGGTPKPEDILGSNYFSVSADGKLTRIPFSGQPDEMEDPLGVDAPGEYLVGASGAVSLITDGITYKSYIDTGGGTKMNIAADGKLTIAFSIATGGLRLNVKNTDGTTYIGADVTATLKTVTHAGIVGDVDARTLTSAAPSAIWGGINSTTGRVNAGEPLLELATGGKTYRVLAPRQIIFTAARLYTFNVRVGATGITVSSDDLSVGDFEVVETTINAEAEPAPLYNGAIPNLLAISGHPAYWVAPEDAGRSIQWGNIDFDAICPAGWHVPTKDEFVAMTGIPADASLHPDNHDVIKTAFPAGSGYWLSTESGSEAWIAFVRADDNMSIITTYSKTSTNGVRCVRAK